MFEALQQKLASRDATIGIIGMGYVGLPLALAFARVGFPVIGFDIDAAKMEQLNAGQSYLKTVASDKVAAMRDGGNFHATDRFDELAACDAVLLCVPTPLTAYREPDMTYVAATTDVVAKHLRKGQLIVLESTTYPGTSDELMRPCLEAGGLICGEDFLLAYSPEREDPGNIDFETSSIPKVVGGHDAKALEIACALYGQIVPQVVPVSSLGTAEAVKLTENIFRAVNIALVNELKVVYERMGIDIWEVVEAAKTKPFGYMPFYPGPGLGGHCIPIDPFYLTWKAREFEVSTRFIELAGEVNTAMPFYVVERLSEALDMRFSKPLNGARILIVGVAYKKNVDDTRESPAFKIISLLQRRGAQIDYYDPHVPEIGKTREYGRLAGWQRIQWSNEAVAGYDAAVICTDHDDVDYAGLIAHCRLIVDTRNATGRLGGARDNVVLA